MHIDPYILAFSAITVIVTIWMGFRSAKTSKTASDFFVAGRSVSVGWNASAISGEYLSAASFMGIAGMVMSSGYDALWYPVCYACGYLFLLLFIAGPLRRFGAYTIPDFAEGRYDSPLFRKIAVCFVLFIGFFYTMPQMKGAGVTLAYIFPGLPYQAGVLLVGAVITLNVALGGMKGITLVQAFQYWAKMFAISVPIFVLMAVYGHYGKQLELNQSSVTNAASKLRVASESVVARGNNESRSQASLPTVTESDFVKFSSQTFQRNATLTDSLTTFLRTNAVTLTPSADGNLAAGRSDETEKFASLADGPETHGRNFLPAWLSPFDQSAAPTTNLISVSTSMSLAAVNGWLTLEPPARLDRLEERVESLFGRGQTYFMTSDAKMIGVLMDYPRLSGRTLIVHTNVGVTRMLGAYSLNRTNWNGTIAQVEAFLKKNGVVLLEERGVTLAVTEEMAIARPDGLSSTRSLLAQLGVFRELGPAKMNIGVQRDGTVGGKVSVGAVSVPIPDIVARNIWSKSVASLGEYSQDGLRKPLPEKAPADSTWISPFGPLTTKAAKAAKLSPEESKPYSLLYTYSLIIALVCGTAGLPHILVRFYTNPDGVAAKRTTMWVMILIGIFYVFPPVFGVLGRNLMPELYNGLTGVKGTDGIVLRLPTILREKYGVLGSILSGVTCAGAFAAFMSTFSGLLVSMTGALAHDVYGRMLKPKATADERLRMFKIAAVLIGGIAIVLGCFVEPLEINFMVGQAFAIAAASYFPLLFMSVWWRGMTMRGAAVGMLTGGLCALFAVALTNVSNLALDKGPMGKIFAGFAPMNDFWAGHPLLRILCEQPAIWTVPLAIGLMIVVSKATRKDVPTDVRMKMLVLHAPEKLGLKQEYIQEHQPGH